tara:strand:+ start:305 stop:538 length:234 start_codon:yes stop_codon:yes gene_type:complete
MNKTASKTVNEKEVKLSDNHVAAPEVDFKGKTNEELIEVRDTLTSQLQQYQTMTVKAAGALEVISQLVAEEDSEDDS